VTTHKCGGNAAAFESFHTVSGFRESIWSPMIHLQLWPKVCRACKDILVILPPVGGVCGLWNESVPILLSQCWFSGLAISTAKLVIHFSNKIHGSNFIKQHPETVMVWGHIYFRGLRGYTINF